MRLPEDVHAAAVGHAKHHAALKIEYDSRHPDAPLPELGSRFGPLHHEIHMLLARDHGGLPTELTALSIGHSDAHNVLHRAYNERVQP